MANDNSTSNSCSPGAPASSSYPGERPLRPRRTCSRTPTSAYRYPGVLLSAAEYLVGPELGELEPVVPDDAPVRAGAGTCPRRRQPHREHPGTPPRGASRYAQVSPGTSPPDGVRDLPPVGRSSGPDAGVLFDVELPGERPRGPRCRPLVPSRRVGVRDRYAGGALRGGRWGEDFAWDDPPSGDIARRYRRLVPRGRGSPGSPASGTCTRPPPAPGIVRYVRRMGRGSAPGSPRGAVPGRRTAWGRRGARCPDRVRGAGPPAQLASP